MADRSISHGNIKFARHSRISPCVEQRPYHRPETAIEPKHVWAIGVRLELAGNHRDLALLNMAVDSKLRGCGLAKMKVVDVMASGQIKERASVLQSKTRKPMHF